MVRIYPRNSYQSCLPAVIDCWKKQIFRKLQAAVSICAILTWGHFSVKSGGSICVKLGGSVSWNQVGQFRWSPAIVRDNLTQPVNFYIRSLAGADPLLSDQLKVFVYDDESVAAFRTRTPSLTQWREVLLALDQQQPHAIIFDKLFDIPDQAHCRTM